MERSPPSSTGGRPIYSRMRPDESPPLSPGAHPIHTPSAASSFSSTPLAIRGASMELAPPPLPPPTNLPTGRDALRGTWDAMSTFRGSGSVRPGSSLFGNQNWDLTRNPSKRPQHRTSLSSSEGLKQPSPLGRGMPFQENKQEDDARLRSLPPIAAGRPLMETHNHQKSTETYDRQLLNRIGRPKTPVRSSTLASVDTSPVHAGRPLRVDTQPFNRLTLADRSVSAHPDSPFKASSPWGARWPQMPQAGTISPSMISSTASTRSLSLAELRSPQSSYEPSTAPSSLSAEHATFSRIGSLDRGSSDLSLLSSAFEGDSEREKNRHGYGGARGPPEWGRSYRGSFDHPIFPGEEHDSEFATHPPPPLPPPAGLREYPQSLPFDGSLPDAAAGPQGLKRKASPSLGDTVADEPPPHASRSRTPGRTTKRPSPPHHPAQPSYGSHSASSVQTASYASSNLSLAPSSVTSYGTPDHLSPSATTGSIGEGSESRHHSQSSFSTVSVLDGPASQSSVASAHQAAGQVVANSAQQQEAASSKTGREGGIAAAPIHVCDCCPKKPKKFNTLEELQTHQREKQFYCTYCHNRFKNKNEAERHQNSLHLRKQSWSCATLGNKIDRAFHPCTATPSANPTQVRSPNAPPADFDVCGYCGKQFPNYPSPDWVERQKHLSEIHKFGECNQSKKFFRADHFRQHLKHSHQGSSGKWTNMLEQACLREEPPPGVDDATAAQDSLTHSQQRAAQAASQQAPMTSYQVEALQSAAAGSGASGMPARSAPYGSAVGSHVQYEPKIDEEDEARE